MSFKLLKQTIVRHGVSEFKDVVQILNDFEDKYKQKLSLLYLISTGKVKPMSFKEAFFKLLDVELKLTVLEQTFSHNPDFLKQIDRLRMNLKEQQKLALAEPILTPALSEKLTEEGEILALEEKLIQKAEKIQEQIDEGFRIEETPMAYTIYGVEYLGNKVTVTWYKNLMDGGNAHTQDEWIKRKANLPDIALYHATFAALYQNRTGPYVVLVEQMKKMFEMDFNSSWMITGTRIKYNPNAKDEIIHNYKSTNEYVMQVDLTGSNDWIESKQISVEVVEALLRTKNKKEVLQVYEWISIKKPYMWRLNSKPNQGHERAVVLGRGVIRFDINCNGYINDIWPARGVVVGAPKEVFKK